MNNDVNTNTRFGQSALVRKYWCSSCNRQEWDEHPPTGWLQLTRKAEVSAVRFGLFCSTACLLDYVDAMETIEGQQTAHASADSSSGGDDSHD